MLDIWLRSWEVDRMDNELTSQLEETRRRLRAAEAELTTAERAAREARVRLALAEAEAASCRAAFEALQASSSDLRRAPLAVDPTDLTDEELADAKRTDAIVAVLQRAEGRPRSIQEILSDLGNLGRTDDKYGAVASTLRYLTEESRIANPARWRYCAI